ncbi:MAG: hypothetical protein J7513_11130 [Solirubrobacteraceae bacterium]|nr:hypothetical protein [Solirubrobacteraceae bacterium]
MTTQATTCSFHPDVETALTCTLCDRPACPDCLTMAAVGQHCDGCTKGRPAANEKGKAAFRVREAVVGVDDYQRLRRPSKLFFVVLATFLGCCFAAWFVEPADDVAYGTAAKATSIFVVISGAVVGLMFHEWAHAIVAYRGGDRSVADKGYLTMDVRHYSDPMLSIAMPIAFLMLGGLPLPGGAVWINRHRLRSKWWETAVSLAGPAINFVAACAIFGLVESGIFGERYILMGALSWLAFIEVGIVILNLLPIPGLDGFGAIEPHLPDSVRAALLPLRQITFVLLLFFIMSPAGDVIWAGARGFTDVVGIDRAFVAYGEELASPRLFNFD